MKEIFKSKKFLIAFSVFALSTVSLISTTYAWYNVSNYLQVSNIIVGTGNSPYLKIGLKNNSTDSIDLYDSITQNDLVSHNQFSNDAKLKGVSSMYKDLWLSTVDLASNNILPTYRELATDLGVHKEGIVANSGYYNLEFMFYSNKDMNLYLSTDTTVKANTIKNAQTAENLSVDVDELNKIEDSLRISFLSSSGYKIFEPNVSTSSTTTLAGRLDYIKDGYFDYDTSRNEVCYGEYYENEGSLKYSESARISEVSGTKTIFNAMSNNIANPLDIEASKANGVTFAKEKSYTLDELSDKTIKENALVKISAYHYTRVIATIYDEGWDLDHTDLVAKSSFDINLVFSADLLFE